MATIEEQKMGLKISFVIAARNDDYGGNFLYRIQVFLNSLLAQLRQQHLLAELVIVEWNPPENEKPLAEALTWPVELSGDVVRIIRVPHKLHHRFPNSDRTPMFEYIAKNVGIRRAKGDYILATNPDILFSDELVRYLTFENLSQESFYRVDRYDVLKAVPMDMPLQKTIEFCKENASKINTLGCSVPLYRWLPSLPREWLARCSIRYKRERRLRLKVRVEDNLHTNASGDFLLMPRRVWFSLRGYPELETLSHIDSYMCCMAASAGIRQVILPSRMRIYHQEHGRGSNVSRPMTAYELWTQECEQMLREKQPMIKNSSDWGLGQESLEEFQVDPTLLASY